MADVFVSYSSHDRDRVASLVEAIERRGWTVWWDRKIDAGVSFDREIEKAIDAAKCVVVVWSAASADSDWVRNEATEGLERGVLVPVLIDPIRLPLAFRRTQTIDITSGENFPEAVLQAIDRICPVQTRIGRNESPFVGRRNELDTLRALIRRTQAGHGGFALLSGEAGVGKSRLVEETSRYAEDSDVMVLSGRCEAEGSAPYQPLLKQTEQAMRRLSAEEFREALGENAPELARLVPEIRQKFPDVPESISLPPEQEGRYLLHGCCEFINRIARAQPLMLVFEDLHWASESTCRLLRYLADRLHECPVLLIGTYRDTELKSGAVLSRTIQELLKERLVEEINLSRLDVSQVSAILEASAGQRPPDDLVSVVFEVTEGNPFFIEEFYRHLDESNKLFRPDGSFASAVDFTSGEVPRGVKLTIENRLARVSDNGRRVLSAAAVKGRVIDYSLLAHIGDFSDKELFDGLEEAEHAAFLEDVSTGREARYQFVHELVRQTLIGSLSLPRRQQIHLQVADAMEQATQSTGERDTAEIAFHLYQAGAAAGGERTLRFLLIASQRALDTVAFEDALELLAMADEVLQEPDRLSQVRILGMRALALRGTGRIEDSLNTLRAGIALCEGVEYCADLLYQRAQLLVDLYRSDEALGDLDQLLQFARSNRSPGLELKAQRLLADAYYRISLDQPEHAEQALDACERTIELARSGSNQHALASALILSGDFADYWSDYQPKAHQNLSEATAIAESLNDETLLLDCATMKLRVSMVTPLEFGVEADDVLEKLEARRDSIRLKEHLFCMIHPARSAGHLKRSVELCDRAIEVAGQLGVPPVQYPTLKAFALIALGRLGEAWEAIGQEVTGERYRFAAALQRYGFLRLSSEVGDLHRVFSEVEPLLVECRALNRIWMVEAIADILATTASKHGKPDDAIAILNRVEPGVRLGTQAMGELALARGDVEDALSRSQELGRLCDDKGMLLLAADAGELAVRCLLRLQRWQEARAQADRQIEFCRESEYRILLWRLLASRAEAHSNLKEPERADEDNQAARGLLETLGSSLSSLELRHTFLTQPLAKEVLESIRLNE